MIFLFRKMIRTTTTTTKLGLRLSADIGHPVFHPFSLIVVNKDSFSFLKHELILCLRILCVDGDGLLSNIFEDKSQVLELFR